MKTQNIVLGLLFACLSLATYSANADTAGFEAGSEYTLTPYHGRIEIHCGSHWIYHTCVATDATPAWASHFMAGAADASKVELEAVHADGSTTKKKAEYDGAAGRTTDKVNLLVATLFQKPLLKLGKNEIRYTLKRGRDAIRDGAFAVSVAKGTPQRCPPRTYWEYSDSACRQPERQCNRYFYEVEGLCRP